MALQLLDVSKFLSQEQAKAVTSSRPFTNTMEPAAGGLQDPGIFGVSNKEKFDTWGFINLEDIIMHPLVFDNLNVINPIFKRILNKKTKVEVVKGELVESDSGGTGLNWIMANWDKINLDKYRTEKNKLFVDFLMNSNKNVLFVNKIPVIPINYRGAHMGNFKMELDELDEIYQKIIGVSKSGQNEFTSEWMQAFKEHSNKDILQDRVNKLFHFFISKLEGKDGFLNGALTAKRLDNVSRMVANARPDIPINSCVIPWHMLLNLFDIFVVAFLQDEANAEYLTRLGISEKSMEEYGQLFDYIYRNSETYTQHYAKNKDIWMEILTNVFNNNPMLRVVLKRDPGWNADSVWCFQPLIGSENSYQVWVPSWVYSPLGGDSMNTNFLIVQKDTATIFEDDNYLITGSNARARIVKTMDSIYKRIP